MKGLHLYNENDTQFLRININDYDDSLNYLIEDLLDSLAMSERKEDKTISWEESKKELFNDK